MTQKNILLVATGVVLILLVVGALRTSASSPVIAHTSVQLVAAAEFQKQLQATPDGVVIDVRTPAEYVAGHIPGAQNIDIQSQNFVTDIATLDPGSTYFVYCHSGRRSALAVSTMQKNGLTHIFELRGGVSSAPLLLSDY